MELIKWESLKEDHVFDEDFKTAIHNYWTSGIGGHHGLNSKNWAWVLSALSLNPIPALVHAFGFKDMIDKKYFEAHWNLSNKQKQIIAQQCSKVKNALLVNSAVKNAMRGRFSDTAISTDVASSNTRLATKDFGDGAITTATCALKIPYKDGHYIVYVTFDSTRVIDIKVLCQDPKNYETHKSFFVTKIPFNVQSIQHI